MKSFFTIVGFVFSALVVTGCQNCPKVVSTPPPGATILVPGPAPVLGAPIPASPPQYFAPAPATAPRVNPTGVLPMPSRETGSKGFEKQEKQTVPVNVPPVRPERIASSDSTPFPGTESV